MTLFRLQPINEEARDITECFGCDERTTDEVLHYARVLAARGLPEDYIVIAVMKYAKVRSEYDGF